MTAKENSCNICSSTFHKVINTHKHIWRQCLQCNTIRRERKASYPFIKFIPAIHKYFPKWLESIPKIRGLKNAFNFLGPKSMHQDFYEYYNDTFIQADIDIPKTKYKDEYNNFKNMLANAECDFKGENFLDLCGEPGYLAQNTSKDQRFKNVFCTAYNLKVAEKINKSFGVDTRSYDFQTDLLKEKFNDINFDFIAIRHAINFCTDLDKLSKDLKSSLKENGKIYIEFSTPSLGTCLRWQFDDYTYEYLYSSESVKRFFSQNGFKCVFSKLDVQHYDYLQGIHPFYVRACYLFYKFKNRRKIDKKSNQLIQNQCVLIFEK